MSMDKAKSTKWEMTRSGGKHQYCQAAVEMGLYVLFES
eukprot:gene6357-2560_t